MPSMEAGAGPKVEKLKLPFDTRQRDPSNEVALPHGEHDQHGNDHQRDSRPYGGRQGKRQAGDDSDEGAGDREMPPGCFLVHVYRVQVIIPVIGAGAVLIFPRSRLVRNEDLRDEGHTQKQG